MYTLPQCLYLLRFAKSRIQFKTQYIFRESSSEEPQIALHDALSKCPTESFRSFTAKFEEVLGSDTFKSVELIPHDWAVFIKNVFMKTQILSSDTTHSAAAWKLLQDKLRTLFAQVYLDHAHQHQNDMGEVFKDTQDKIKDRIRTKVLEFLGQLHQNGDQKSVETILRYFELAALTRQEAGNDMDDYAVGVVFSAPLMHALRLNGAFLAPSENPMQTASNFKLEYAFFTLVLTSLLQIPELSNRRDMMRQIADKNQGERFEVENIQLQQMLWQTRPMRLSLPTPPLKHKSKKNQDTLAFPTFEIADIPSRGRTTSQPSVSLTRTMRKLSLSGQDEDSSSYEDPLDPIETSKGKAITFSDQLKSPLETHQSPLQERRGIRRTLSSPRLRRKGKQVDS